MLVNSINSSCREENPFLLAERHVLFSPLSRDQQTLSSIMFGLRFPTYIQLHLNKEVKVKLKINSNKILIYIQGCFCTFYVIYLLRALETTPLRSHYQDLKNDLSATLLRSMALFSTSFWIFSISSTSTLTIMQSNIRFYGCAYLK